MTGDSLDDARRETDRALRRLAAANTRVEELEQAVDRLSRRLLALEQEYAQMAALDRQLADRDATLARLNGSSTRTLAARLRRSGSGDRIVE